MKKLFNILIVLITLSFITAGLYVFGLPPFQGSKQLYPSAQTQEQLPDFLKEDKVSRAKSYDEHMKRGALLEENKFYSLAIAEFQQANKLNPSNADPFFKIGHINFLTGDYSKAEQNFQKAISLQPENQEAAMYLGRTYIQERKLEQAKAVFSKMTENNKDTYYYQGILAAYYGDYDNAKKLLQKAVDIGKTDLTGKKAQNYLSALSEFDFNQGGQTTHLKTLLGRSYAQTGEYQMAIPLLFDVIKTQKDYRDAWMLLGYSYLNIDQYPDAVQALEQAMRLDPQNNKTLFYLGLAYYGQNNLKLAASTLEKAKSFGYQPVIQVDQKLAEIYLELKEYDKSVSSYENVVSLNDQDINYYIRPMWIYIEKLNQPQKAVALAQKAYKNHPDQPMGFNLMGWAQVSNGQLNEAEKNLNKALELDPKLDAAWLNLGLLSEKRGDFNKALNYYSKAHDIGNGDGISNSAAERYNILIAKMKSNSAIGQANVTE